MANACAPPMPYRAAQLSMEELWLRYFTMGGMAGHFEIEAYLHGVIASRRFNATF